MRRVSFTRARLVDCRAMNCPKCQGDLTCVFSVRTGHPDMPVSMSHQWWKCKTCDAKYYGLCEDDRRNMFDDSVEHRGYHANPQRWAETLKKAEACKTPQEETCRCAVHQSMHEADFMGERAWYSNS